MSLNSNGGGGGGVPVDWNCAYCRFNNCHGYLCALCGSTCEFRRLKLGQARFIPHPYQGLSNVSFGSMSTPHTPTKAVDVSWNCTVCKLLNKPSSPVCEGCGIRKAANCAEVQQFQQQQKLALQGFQSSHQGIQDNLHGQSSGAIQPPPTVVAQEAFKLANGTFEKVKKWTFHWGTAAHPEKHWQEDEVMVEIGWNECAGMGSMRIAVRMIDLSRPVGKRACVAKYYKENNPVVVNSYFVDVETQVYCQAISRAFNARNPPKEVTFNDVWILERTGENIPPNMKYLGAEPYITGEYVKYNNNFGFVHPLNRNTPASFSHFSYEFTKQQMMVVDIQGVGDMYTDPQIHTHNGEGFGGGNMGRAGMAKFLATHCCNPICAFLKLPLRSNLVPTIAGTAINPKMLANHPQSMDEVYYKVSNFIHDLQPKHDSALAEDLTLLNMEMEEYNDLVEIFLRVDTDQDGFLTKAEVAKLMAFLKIPSTAVSASNYNQYVQDGLLSSSPDGKLSFKEFVLWYKGCK